MQHHKIMENRRTYEEIIGYLRRASPAPEDSEALTRSVMAQVEHIAQNKKKCKALRITGWLSGVAACLMLCLLMYQASQFAPLRQDEVKPAALLVGQARVDTPNMPQICAIGSAESGKMSITEIIREKLGEQNRKEQRYAAYLRSINMQDNF
ncbi:MAG: hypothetical protein LBB79_09130 [Prevotellaceae bacterium]|jgi:hypothetical protein|nr:hypothetical protein [Prevotellaceae bacterium]